MPFLAKKSALIIFSFLFAMIFSTTPIFSNDILFSDDFEDGNSEGWIEFNGGANGEYEWNVVQDDTGNYAYEGTVVKDTYGDYPSYVIAGSDGWTDYSLEFELKGIEGKDKVFFFRYNENGRNYGVNIIGGKIHLFKNPGGFHKERFINTSIDQGFIPPINGWHKIKIDLTGDRIKIYLNNVLHYDFTDSNNPILSGKLRFEAWPGYYAGIGGRTTIQIDEVVVKSLSEEGKEPVVLVPGLAASWNTKAMVLGQEVSQNDWRLIPFAKPVYQRLMGTLAENGYTEGEDLFLWPYDWRQSVDDSARDLNDFVDNLGLEASEKIDLIGHSLGGMVSRDLAQDYPNLVDQVITVGSPHQGAVQAYQGLAGGKIGEQRDLEWIGMQLLLHINRRGFETNAEVVRNVAPVLYNLTPTFDYLNKNGRMLSAESEHSYINEYLIDLNSDATTNDFINQAEFIAGNMPESTPLQLNLGSTTLVDQLLGLWPDGKPQETIFGAGDQTVLRKSSFLGANPSFEYPLEHKELVHEDEPITDILNKLGVTTPTLAAKNDLPSADDMLIFYLASPANLEVENLDTGVKYSPETPDLQMIYLPYPDNPQNFKANLRGTDEGVYHLYLGQLTPQGDFWQTYQEEINLSQEKEHSFLINPQQPETDPLLDITGMNFLKLARNEAKDLKSQDNNQILNQAYDNINQAINGVNQQNWNGAIGKIKQTIDKLSEYRKGLSGNEIDFYNQSIEISKLLITAWQRISLYQQPVSSRQANRDFRNALGTYSLAQKYLRLAKRRGETIGKFKPLSIKDAEELINQAKNEMSEGKYNLVQPKSYLIKTLSQEGYIQTNTSRTRSSRTTSRRTSSRRTRRRRRR